MRDGASREGHSKTARIAAMLGDLKKAGLKVTAQRIAVIETFACDLSHPTAQELFDRLRVRFPSLSFATVYNTLDALASAGLASTLRVTSSVAGLGGAARFDPNAEPHHHAVCDACGAVSDIPTASLAPGAHARARLADVAPGFVVRVEERVYRGLCAACAGAN
jgi:Fur family peroxide stress response transcriptional regulator